MDPTAAIPVDCNICNESFSSKTKLFQHLCVVHGHSDPRYDSLRTQRSAILVGYEASKFRPFSVDQEVWNKEDSLKQRAIMDDMEMILLPAIYMVENNITNKEELPEIVYQKHPKGYSRSSRSSQLTSFNVGIESTTHALGDVIGMSLKTLSTTNELEAWVKQVNDLLPSTIRVFYRKTIINSYGDFHAEMSTSQRRYEYMLPMDLVMPEALSKQYMDTVDTEEDISSSAELFQKSHESLSAMDQLFPKDSPEGIARVKYFVAMKKIMRSFLYVAPTKLRNKRPKTTTATTDCDKISKEDTTSSEEIKESTSDADVAAIDIPPETDDTAVTAAAVTTDGEKKPKKQKKGYKEKDKKEKKIHTRQDEIQKLQNLDEKRISFHNFVIGGITPEESACHHHVDRFYHRDLLILPEYPSKKWVIFSISGDDFLHGQVCKIIASTLAVTCGWLPLEYILDALSIDYTFLVPACPSWALYLAECKFSIFESKHHDCIIDPRRMMSAAVADKMEPSSYTQHALQDMDQWKKHLQLNIAKQSIANQDQWFYQLQSHCNQLLNRWNNLKTFKNRSIDAMNELYIQQYKSSNVSCSAAAVPVAYQEVLRLLRQADQSGLWPPSSTARQRVLDYNTLVESGKGNGGTFSVGAFPKHLVQPKGNQLFPELMIACFRLEKLLRPNRPPSGTIAINKHARFRPHRDNGVGNGQALSLIVALGDFIGGELVVEDEVCDIRYNPIEFDGWSQRHSTLPFVGERYTLVWFTPLGVEEKDKFWLQDL